MSASTALAALDEARARSDALVERLGAHVERIHVAGERLAESVERLQDLEQTAAEQFATSRTGLLTAQQGCATGAEIVAHVVKDAHEQLDALGARLLDLDVGSEAAAAKDQIAGHLAEFEQSASSAADTLEEVHDTLTESRASVEDAADELTTTAQESSEIAADAAEALQAALDAASDQLKQSIGDAVDSFLTKGADFRGSVDDILTSTVQAGLRDLGARAREYVEQAIRAKVKEVVRELVRSLLDALKSFGSHGSDVGLVASDSDAKFGRMGRSHESVAASAQHVHAEKDRLQAKADADPEGD